MNFDLRKFLDSVLAAPARTKLVVLLSAAAVVAAIALGGWVAGQPHFVKLYGSLSDAERVAVEKALAGSEVRYRVSDFPGPFVVYVDQSQYDQAQIAVALAEALKQAPQGIDSGSTGAATIFMSQGERNQAVLKRDWQEAERLLEQLDFVTAATVTTSMPDSSPLRAKKPVMVSVALQIAGGQTLSDEQASNVAKLVRYRFGVPSENVVITDQSGRTLYDPTAAEEHGQDVHELLQHAAEFDRELASKANAHIEAAFGARKALVTVTSQWNYDQSTTDAEAIDPETVAIKTERRDSKTPQGSNSGPGSSAGGPAGVSSNVAEFGNESAAVPGGSAAGSSGALASTTDETKVFEAGKTRTRTVRNVPRLERLSVALALDESLAAKRDEIQRIVEAAVGFDKTRSDAIGVSTTAFAVPEVAAEPGEPAAQPGDGAPSPMVELLLRRGVEIASALAFLFLLFTSLKGGSRAGSKKGAHGAPSGDEPEPGSVAAALAEGGLGVDPEALARAQIEELVRSDPRRVGEILTRWVDEKSTVKA